jgi:hypothetical protein
MEGPVNQCAACGKTTTNWFETGQGVVCHECLLIGEAIERVDKERGAGGGVKFDGSKLRLDLIPAPVLTFDAAIFSMGAQKYDDDNWKGGMQYRRLLGAAYRHILQRCLGERLDHESHLPHLAHARWNLGAMLYYDLYPNVYGKFDDVSEECPEALALFTFKEDPNG